MFRKKTKKCDCRYGGKIIANEGVKQIPLNAYFDITLSDGVITISNSNITFAIQKSQVVGVGTYGDREVVEKNKSAIARGIVGAAFGPVGAVVGGMSGIGHKKQIKQRFFSYLCFTASSGEQCRIDLELDAISHHNAVKFNEMVTPNEATVIML